MSAVLKLLPARWRVAGSVARRLALALALPLEQWRALVRMLPGYLTPDGAPASWLDWLLSLLGYPYLPDLSDARKRALLAGGVERWSRKGTSGMIEEYVQALAGVDAEVVATVGPACIAGVARASAICGPGVTAWRFTIRVPTGSITEQDLRALLAIVVPSFTLYEVEFI